MKYTKEIVIDLFNLLIKEDLLWYTLASLISAENEFTEEICTNTLELFNVAQTCVDDFNLDEKQKDSICQMLENGIKIINQEMENLKK